MENKTKTRSNQLQLARNLHRATLEDRGISLDEIGLKVGQAGCVHNHGAGAPLLVSLRPNLDQVFLTTSLRLVAVGISLN